MNKKADKQYTYRSYGCYELWTDRPLTKPELDKILKQQKKALMRSMKPVNE